MSMSGEKSISDSKSAAVLQSSPALFPNAKVVQGKVVLLGDSAVGKSSLVLRFVKKQFSEYQESTIGAAFLTQTVTAKDYTVKLEIWDTAGQERYHTMSPMYYRNAAVAVIVYDITSANSFARAKFWIKELQKNGPQKCSIVLAGNKLDLADRRVVDTEEARLFAEEKGALFFEVSAKTEHNVDQMFETAALRIPKNLSGKSNGLSKTIDLSSSAQPEETSKCCN